MESGGYALGVSKNDMNVMSIYSSLKSSDIRYDKKFLRRGISELKKGLCIYQKYQVHYESTFWERICESRI